MPNDRLKECLEIWRDWMLVDDVRSGYPSKVAVFATGGINCFDDMEDSGNAYIVDSVNGIMRSWNEQNKNYRCVVIEMSLGIGPKVFTYNRMSFEDALDDAYVSMEVGLRKRGVL